MSRLNNIYRREPDTDKNICTKVKKKRLEERIFILILPRVIFFLLLDA